MSANLLLQQALGLLAMGTATFSNVPDRINREKYQGLYETSRLTYNTAQAQADQKKQDYQNTVNRRQNLERDQTNLQNGIASDQQAITNNQNKIQALKTQAGGWQSQWEQNLTTLANLTPVINQLQDQANQKERELTTAGQLHKAKLNETNTQSSEVQNLQRVLRQNEEQVVRQNSEVDLFRREYDGYLNEAKTLLTSVKTITENQAADMGKVAPLKAKFSQISDRLPEVQDNILKTKQKKEELEKIPNRTPAQNQQLTEVSNRLREIEGRKQNMEQELQNLGQQLAPLNRSIFQARNQLREITQRQMPELEVKLGNAAQKTTNALAQVAATGLQVNNLREQVRIGSEKYNTLYAEFQRLERNLTDATNSYNSVAQSLRQNFDQKTALEQKNNELQAGIQNANTQSNGLQNAIQSYEVAIEQKRSSLSSIGTDLLTIARREEDARDVSTRAAAVALDLKGKMDQSYRDYQTVVAQYQKELSDAQAMARTQANEDGTKEGSENGQKVGSSKGMAAGKSQGSAAGEKSGRQRDYDAGYAQGNVDGNKRARAVALQEGTQDGKTTGDREGYAAGLIEGLNQGTKQGQATGHNAGYAETYNETNRKNGYAQGLQEGMAQAVQKAQSEAFPKGRQSAEAEILKSEPSAREDVGPKESADKVFKGAFLKLISNAGIPKAHAAEGDDRCNYIYRRAVPPYEHPDFIAGFKAVYDERYRHECVKTYEANYKLAYDAEYKKNYDASFATSQAQVYADETTRGQNDGDRTAYAEIFPSARRAAYEAAYTPAYEEGRKRGTPVRFQEGFKAGEVTGLAQGKALGLKLSLDEGRAKGKEDGYNQNIDQEMTKAFEAGKASLRKEYAENPKPVLVAAKFYNAPEGGFPVATKASIAVTIRNFGGVAINENDLKVEGLEVSEQSGPFLVSKNTNTLGAVASQKEIQFTSALEGKVIGADEGLKYKVKVTYKGNTLGEKVVSAPIKNSVEIYFSNSDAKHPLNTNGATWYVNYAWMRNLEKEEQPAGYRIKVVPVSSGVKVYQSTWDTPINYGKIGATEWQRQDMWVQASRTDLDNMFYVEVANEKNQLIYRGKVKAPIKNAF